MQVCKTVKSFVFIPLEDFEELIKAGWVKPVCVRRAQAGEAHPTKKGNDGFAPLSPSYIFSFPSNSFYFFGGGGGVGFGLLT